jgi:hypothetical protein
MTKSVGPVDRLHAWRFRLDDEDVAVRQHVQRARMLQSLRERLDLEPGRDFRRLAILPADDRREMHRRKQVLLRRRQVRMRADLALDVESFVVVAGGERQRRDADQGKGAQCATDGRHGALHGITPTRWR